ncbi:YncE family protein [Rufibacter tibetensis]|uniref:SMP-30/Gluconolactonase/LRE-like region domain-containing protein n=1 Tax=Rufibacter tibetensis TaxID=512763 RepID=A0A0P0CQ39_9BACT|nr:DUF5074 domain-containing protein [Rufibacter tibetensis]ALI99467.1 hypothetical protein DC20_11430 [Rufibacter tibetensis]
MKRFPLFKQALHGLLGAALLFATSCQEEEKELLPVFETGVLISTMGETGTSSGSVSYYDRATGNVEADLFQKANNRALDGNLVSMATALERTYLITSKDTIEVLASRTFTSAGTISGITSPRRLITGTSRTAYISSWITSPDSGRVVQVNLGTNAITKNMKVGPNPGAMALVGSRLFVANEGRDKVNVLNTTTFIIDTTLTVGDNPNSMVVDASGILWVLCGGKADGSTKGRLVRINPSALRSQPREFEFSNSALQPHGLTLSGSKNRIFFAHDGVYSMDINALSLPALPIIPRRVEALGQDPADGLLYTGRAQANGSNGWVIRYRSNGAVVDSFEVQGVPKAFGFR